MQPLANEATVAVNRFLQANIDALQGIVRSYVARAGLAKGEELQNMTLEIINEATLEALSHADQFLEVRQPRAWFLGISANIVKRRLTTRTRRNQRELSLGRHVLEDGQMSESDFFDHLSHLTQPGPEEEVEVRTQVAELLALATPEDRRILRLAFLQDLDTQSLALALNVPAGTARVRLYRALQRLRNAWHTRYQQDQGRGQHA